jgi:hypothetical protein
VSDASGLAVVTYNTETLSWESVPIVAIDAAAMRLVCRVDHFSLYAIGAATAGADGVGNNGNLPPVADPGTDFTGYFGDTIKLNGTKSYDPNSKRAKLTYSWTLVDHPEQAAVTLSKATSATPSFIAPVPGDYTFSLVVSNTNGTSGERYVTVHVPVSLQVTAPSAGSSISLGTDTTRISWSVSGINPKKGLSIYLVTNGGASEEWTLLKSGEKAGAGYYDWKAKSAQKALRALRAQTDAAVVRVCVPAPGSSPAFCGTSGLFSIQ